MIGRWGGGGIGGGVGRHFVSVCVGDCGVVVCEEGKDEGRGASWEVVYAAECEGAEDEGKDEGWEEGRVGQGGKDEGLQDILG